MITAKNYAAQAEKSLSVAVNGINNSPEYKQDKMVVTYLRDCLSQAVHFVVPDGGRILDDNLKGIYGQKLHLPYPIITVEYASMTEENIPVKRVVIALEYIDSQEITVYAITCNGNDFVWVPMPYRVRFSCGVAIPNNNYPYEKTVEIEIVLPKFRELLETSNDQLRENIAVASKGLFELLEALSCKNVEQSIYQPASPKNVKRVKSHKLPIYETRFLTIKAGEVKGKGSTPEVKGTHASPRQHLRRGHIRRLDNGNIWVNSCVVGNSEKGVIDKSYGVAL